MEEGRKDREEIRRLLRETSRKIERLADRLETGSDHVREKAHAADEQLRKRIDLLVAAIGKLIAK